MNVRDLINKWVILGALALAGLLLLITAIGIGLTSARQASNVGVAPADITVIPAPTVAASWRIVRNLTIRNGRP